MFKPKRTEPLTGLSKTAWKGLFKSQSNAEKASSKRKAEKAVSRVRVISESQALRLIAKSSG